MLATPLKFVSPVVKYIINSHQIARRLSVVNNSFYYYTSYFYHHCQYSYSWLLAGQCTGYCWLCQNIVNRRACFLFLMAVLVRQYQQYSQFLVQQASTTATGGRGAFFCLVAPRPIVLLLLLLVTGCCLAGGVHIIHF